MENEDVMRKQINLMAGVDFENSICLQTLKILLEHKKVFTSEEYEKG